MNLSQFGLRPFTVFAAACFVLIGLLGLSLYPSHRHLSSRLPDRVADIIAEHNRAGRKEGDEGSLASGGTPASHGAFQLRKAATKGAQITSWRLSDTRIFFPMSQAAAWIHITTEDGRSMTVRLHFIGGICNGVSLESQEGQVKKA